MNKKNGLITIMSTFLLLFIIKDIELFFVKTDQTIIGENVINKLCCILLIICILALRDWNFNELGFNLNRITYGMKYGLLLGISTFFISYLVELIALHISGKTPALNYYISSFSLSESNVTGSGALVLILCIIGNIINVIAEEGLFRGLFIKIGTEFMNYKAANMLQALLFGLWHISNVILPLAEGNMTVGTAIIMSIGYVVLAYILAYEWGLCKSISGVIWVGFFEHFFNNFISNSLHVVTDTGTDEFMILRIVLSNILSLVFVIIAVKYKKRHCGDNNDYQFSKKAPSGRNRSSNIM